MKKIILSLFIIAGVFLALVSSSIYLTDFDKIHKDFIKNTKIDASIVPNKINYTLKKFPTPTLVIEEIKQEGKAELKDIEIKFSLLSILKFNPRIADLTIGQATIHLLHDDVNFLNHDEFITELIGKEALSISAKINKLIFVESDKDIPLTIENFVFVGHDKTTTFTGEVNAVGKLKGDFTRNDDLTNFNLDITGTGYDLKLQETYENALLKNGKMEITTSSLAEKLIMLIPDLSNFSDKLDSNEEIKVTLDIVPSDGWLNFKNVIINSKSIQGTAEMEISKTPQNASNININFSNIDLDSWSKAKNPTQNNNKTLITTSNKFDFSKNQMKATIVAKLIKLDDNNVLTDVNLKALIQNDHLNIEDFSGTVRPVTKNTPETQGVTLEEIGQFKITGIASQNSFRSLFAGTIAVVHNDLNDLAQMLGNKELRSENKIPYSLISDIKFSSVDISLQNLLIKTPDTEISGALSTKFIGNSPRTNATLKFTKINLDDKNFPALNYIYNYALGLTKDSKHDDYLNKFIPLRKIDAISSYDITFDQLNLNGTPYTNVSFNLGLSPGRVRLENLAFSNGANYIDMGIDLLASGIKPSFSIVIHSGVVEADFLAPQGLLNLRNKILENFALDKVDLYMSFVLNKISHENFELGRVVFRAQNNKSLLQITNFDADIFGGRMVSSGSILLEPYTINFVYALNSANLTEISKLMPTGTLESGGGISASGMWSTNGKTLEELLYNLYTKSTIVTKDIKISNFSIDNIVQAASAPNYNTKNFPDDMKKALLTGTTDVNDLKTNIELSKGIFNLQQIAFKTKYTSGMASATFNLYDSNLELSSVFSFFLAKPTAGRSYTDYSPVKLSVTASGNILTPKKEADTKAFEEAMQGVKSK